MRHGRGIRAIRTRDDFDLEARAPEFHQLLDGGGAKVSHAASNTVFFCDWM